MLKKTDKMEIKYFYRLLLLSFLAMTVLTACDEENNMEEGRQKTGYKEYTLTVASEKLPGVFTSDGSNICAHLFAVRKDQATEWEPMADIAKFEYEEGYEYRIRISETNYLDYRMGQPAWTEYELLEVISKEHKNSDNLPPHFIPRWYFEQRCPYINPEFTYAINADKNEEIENDLITDATYRFRGMRYYLLLPLIDRWYLLDADMNTVGAGNLIMRSKEEMVFPESYKLLKPEQQVLGAGHLDFVTNAVSDNPVLQYDLFICRKAHSRSAMPRNVDLWLYKDLTDYYKTKYPEANVKAVVIRYEVSGVE